MALNIDKAIEILTEFNVTWSQASHKEKRLAILLGIEALKLIAKMRAEGCTFFTTLLPSETKD